MRRIKTDILVIGGGLAGLAAALQARRSGCDVVIAAKGGVGRSGNTILARNSVAAVVAGGHDGDSVARHVRDTLAGGAGLNDPGLVKILAGEAGDAIDWLVDCGVPFLSENGKLVVKGSPGHTGKRILTAIGAGKSPRLPGLAITGPLLQKALESGVRLLENVLVTGLIRRDDGVAGACGLDRHRPGALVVEARAVILASGGAGRLYPFTTNAADVTGDGYALARLAGARLRDMEFVQFHPVVATGPPKLVLSTALFNEGAVLRNRLGEAFMSKYSPLGNLATRDVMARASFTEINEGRGTWRGGVYLDVSAIPPEIMAAKYGDIQHCLKNRKLIEVAPAAHFMMGGVVIDDHCRTTVPGLYACGEVAGGVHGANRLAGNALTEAVVFGRLAGRSAALEVRDGRPRPGLADRELEALLGSNNLLPDQLTGKRKVVAPAGAMSAFAVTGKELRRLMGAHAGLVRCESGLREARNRLVELDEQADSAGIAGYRELLEYHQVKLMLTAAGTIVDAALQRKESVGAHYRVDGPAGHG